MLEQMGQRLRTRRTFEEAVATVLDDVIALHGAEFGNIQMPVGDNLRIVEQRGFSAPFLDAFRTVSREDGSACGRALRNGKPVIVPDVEEDTEYAPLRGFARKAGYRAVQTTPLLTSKGAMFGVVSTHFVNVHSPTPIEMEVVGAYGRFAADYLYELLAGEALAPKATAMSDSLYAEKA
jgi:GAF domain-containing protein